MPLRQVNDKFWVGDGPPTTGDSLCSYLPGFPIQSVYVDSETGIMYVRNAINGVPADWVSLTVTPSYKVYTALLTQTGINDPVATVISNTLGFDIRWVYDDIGNYVTKQTDGSPLPANSFTPDKTWCIISQSTSFITDPKGVSIQNDNDAQIEIQTGWDGVKSDSVLFKNCVEIRVYP